MRIVVVRHGIAVDREEFAQSGQPDESRPLTKRGRRRLRVAARGLRRVVGEVDILATSPYVRARETADLLVPRLRPNEGPVTLGALVPDAPLEETRDWLSAQSAEATVVLTGHEPHLSRLIAWLVSGGGHDRAFTELTRGGACLLESDVPVVEGAARMGWLLRAGQLRRLARA